jgi:hypothetical protein
MRIPLLLSICLVLFISACKKQKEEEALPAPVVPTVADYRDTVLGAYIGTAHLVTKVQMCSTVTVDTTFIDTINVTNFTSPTVIYLDGRWANLRTDYSIGDDEWHYAHGGIGGNFMLTPQATNLVFSSGDSWGGICHTYEFTGVKQ